MEYKEGYGETARRVAALVLSDDEESKRTVDPRHELFAVSIIEELGSHLRQTSPVIQKIMAGAASAAEDLNVEPFQGLTEVIQNADDVRATEVRFALRLEKGARQLLVVHDGEPVTFNHILPMTLPFLTTKGSDAYQKGRFGIGLKTLARISSQMSIHSKPYHFRAENLSLGTCEPEPNIPGFYDSRSETMLVLNLKPSFSVDGLKDWFSSWDDDGLLFLNTVRAFRWQDLSEGLLGERKISVGAWEPFQLRETYDEILDVRTRRIKAGSNNWDVFTANLTIPSHLERAHKAKGDFTPISIAVPTTKTTTNLFVSFKTRVPTNLPFSVDAQFDPSTAREDLIDNPWNRWLIEATSQVVASIAKQLLATEPVRAWAMVPLGSEMVGVGDSRWPSKEFSSALGTVRGAIASSTIMIDGQLIPMGSTSCESEDLVGLLDDDDVEGIFPDTKSIFQNLRDDGGRWRQVLTEVGVSKVARFEELLIGMAGGNFARKTVDWWVEAGARITTLHPDEKIYGAPFLLSDDHQPLACAKSGSTSRPLVFGGGVSAFARRWRLLDRINNGYGESEAGQTVRDWLVKRAAYTIDPDPAIELSAFAERHQTPIAVSEDQLREIRDRFDLLSDKAAEEIGQQVGRALQLNGQTYKKGKKRPGTACPADSYLPASIDGERADWPNIATGLPGLFWISASYGEALRSSVRGNGRKRPEGKIARGPRRFLMLLGAECAPRVVPEEGYRVPTRSTQLAEISALSAEKIGTDFTSPDLERAIAALQRLPKRERRERGVALMRVLSRYWSRTYKDKRFIECFHETRRHYLSKGKVTSSWLSLLRENAWVVVGNGDLTIPSKAVIRSAQTETLYDSSLFIYGLQAADIDEEFASAIGLITAVRASDLIDHLGAIKSGKKTADLAQITQVYKTLAGLVSEESAWTQTIGDVPQALARELFNAGTGLICLKKGEWSRAEDLFSGRDIFHEPSFFVPSGASYASLWRILGIRPPDLSDCSKYCRKLSQQPYSTSTEARLMDIYRRMDALLSEETRRNKDRFNTIPLATRGGWVEQRPIYLVEDSEVRSQIEKALPQLYFWNPPCDMRELNHLISALGVKLIVPNVEITSSSDAAKDQGEQKRSRFKSTVELLSTELARSDPLTRERMKLSWDALGEISLFIYPSKFDASVRHEELSEGRAFNIQLRAFLTFIPLSLYAAEEALAMPKAGGRAVASLFPHKSRPHIEALWSACWMESQQDRVEAMRFASDEEKESEIVAAAQSLASSLEVDGGKIEVSLPKGRVPSVKVRRLKSTQGGIASVVVQKGISHSTRGSTTVPLASNAPNPSAPVTDGLRDATIAEFTNEDVEQRGWEILKRVLNRTNVPELVDFRKRHGVGADGAIEWKQFVELKASARTIPSSVDMTNSEYQRAKERGRDYILALVYGLEEGYQTEARLIIDPVQNLPLRPVAGISLTGLALATAVILKFEDSDLVSDDDATGDL